MVQEGCEVGFVHTVAMGYGIAVGAVAQLAIPFRELAQRHDFRYRPQRRQRFRVFAIVMLNEGFMALASFDFQFLALLGMVPVGRRFLKQAGIQMGVRAIAVCEAVGPAGTDRNSHALDGVEYQQAQFAVENVQVQNMIEAHARSESMAGMVGLEG
jgi:hypothetical protein